jgi:hypothetical protein
MSAIFFLWALLGSCPVNQKGDFPMAPPSVETSSRSEVLNSSAIFVFRVIAVSFGAWQPEQGGLQNREVNLTLDIEDSLKGTLLQRKGEPFKLLVRQRGTGSYRVMDYYGLWSHVSLQPDVRFVAFCKGQSNDATVLLTNDQDTRLLDPQNALPDTKAALELEARQAPSSEIIQAARNDFRQRRGIFARYIWERTKELALQSPSVFEQVMEVVEDPATTDEARTSLLTCAYEDLSMSPAPSRKMQMLLIRAMFNLLSSPWAKSLQEELAERYLPNMLGLEAGPTRFAAGEIFGDRPAQRQRALTGLRAVYKTNPNPAVSRLIEWTEDR